MLKSLSDKWLSALDSLADGAGKIEDVGVEEGAELGALVRGLYRAFSAFAFSFVFLLAPIDTLRDTSEGPIQDGSRFDRLLRPLLPLLPKAECKGDVLTNDGDSLGFDLCLLTKDVVEPKSWREKGVEEPVSREASKCRTELVLFSDAKN